MKFYIISAIIALTVPVIAQDCKNGPLSSCLLAATPSGLVPQFSTTQLACGDQACVCSAMSLEFDCYRTYCPDASALDAFNSNLAIGCSGYAPTGAVTGTGTAASPTSVHATTTMAKSASSTAAASVQSTSTRAGGADVLNAGVSGGFLVVFIGVLANL